MTVEQEELKDIPLQKAQELLQELLRSPGVPAQIKVMILASTWNASVDSFRDEEDKSLRNGTYNSVLSAHRYGLSHLISKGEHLLDLIQQHGLTPDAPFTVTDIKGTLQSLHDTFRGEHQKINSESTNAEIDKLFTE